MFKKAIHKIFKTDMDNGLGYIHDPKYHFNVKNCSIKLFPAFKIKKFFQIRVPHVENPREFKKSADLEKFFKNRFSLGPPRDKNRKKIFKKFYKTADFFVLRSFFDKGNSISKNSFILTAGNSLVGQ
jgi:hypothetical protein